MSYRTKASPTVPTVKSEEALAWEAYHNRLRAIAAQEAADLRRQRLNELVAEHWPKFEEALEKGEILELPAITD